LETRDLGKKPLTGFSAYSQEALSALRAIFSDLALSLLRPNTEQYPWW